jgi:hypothetical protein
MIRKICVDESDFKRCIIFKRKMEVWTEGELEVIGEINCITDSFVKVDGNYYLRTNCTFFMI